MQTLKRLYKQLLIAVDQLLNVFPFLGYADETISARLYRNRDNSWYWYGLYRTLNIVVFWQQNHCKSAYENEKQRKHLPKEYQ